MAEEHARAIAPQVPANRFGLSPDEVEVAKNSFGAIRDQSGRQSDMTLDQKCELYAHNRNRLRAMRASGQYDDSQGKVFKR